MSHTPGPLTIHGPSKGGTPTDDGGDYGILDQDGFIIGEAIRLAYYGQEHDAKANATLWATAPDLLTFAERFIDWAAEGDVNVWRIPSLTRDAMMAVKKARGEQ